MPIQSSLSQPHSPVIQGRNGFVWGQVPLGGGGYVTGIYLHPQTPDLVYLKTDVGGAYRWNALDRRWIPLMDWLPRSLGNHFGCESLAFDPNDPEVVYLAAGKFLFEENGTIYKSRDRGSTWTKLDLNLTMGGNENKRWIGERLAVDPFDSQHLLFGSRLDGLWRSRDAGASWQAADFPGTLKDEIGITEITFDPAIAGRAYAAAYGDGIYQSDDGSSTWVKLSGSPARPHRIALASLPTATLYVTHTAGVMRYRDRVWTDITPLQPATAAFNALAIDPFDPERLLAVYDQFHERHDPRRRVFVSKNGGTSWRATLPQVEVQVPWWLARAWADSTAAIAFDPHARDRVWLTDWWGAWLAEDIEASPVIWRNQTRGHEELVTFALISLPAGAELIAGVADWDSFAHSASSYDRYPQQLLGGKAGPRFQD
ncbi:MAG: hypothetical protein AAFY15_11420, partial [Cyanobacteria bacterium J06648_11]